MGALQRQQSRRARVLPSLQSIRFIWIFFLSEYEVPLLTNIKCLPLGVILKAHDFGRTRTVHSNIATSACYSKIV
jgi:hypothetical protein